MLISATLKNPASMTTSIPSNPSQLPAPKLILDGNNVTATWSALGTEHGWMVELKCDEWDEPLCTPLTRCHTPSLGFEFKDAGEQNIRCRVALRGHNGEVREPSWSNWAELKRRKPTVTSAPAPAAEEEEEEDN